MRVNIYEEELTDRFEITKSKDARFIGIRLFLELPATVENGRGLRVREIARASRASGRPPATSRRARPR